MDRKRESALIASGRGTAGGCCARQGAVAAGAHPAARVVRARGWKDLARPSVIGAFLVVALPWYLLCYLRNGVAFPRTFFWEQHFQRLTAEYLPHPQPWWFYGPVLGAALLPWTPLLFLLARRSLYTDARHRFLLLWLLFGLVFFSLWQNKLPGYLLPLMPAAAALMGTSIKRARWALPAAALCLISVPLAVPLLPQALAGGLSRAPWPAFRWTWVLPALLAAGIYWLERRDHRAAALAAMAVAVTAGVVVLKLIDLPVIDRAASARPLWREIAGERDRVCVGNMHRNWRYGLNYYSVTPLPDCSQSQRPLQVEQTPGQPPVIKTR